MAALEFIVLQKLDDFRFLVTLCVGLAAARQNLALQAHLNNYMLRQLIDGDQALVKSQKFLQLRSQRAHVSLNVSNFRLLQISTPLG